MTDPKYAKILFRFYSDIPEEWTVETMWVETIDAKKGLYKLDNIPFYAGSIASEDIIFAEYDESEKMLAYRKTIKYSGNSTIHIVLMHKETEINTMRDVLKNMDVLQKN